MWNKDRKRLQLLYQYCLNHNWRENERGHHFFIKMMIACQVIVIISRIILLKLWHHTKIWKGSIHLGFGVPGVRFDIDEWPEF